MPRHCFGSSEISLNLPRLLRRPGAKLPFAASAVEVRCGREGTSSLL